MKIYEQLAAARKDFHTRSLKKSGHNKFAGYKYFELADFLVPGMDALQKQGLTPVVSFGSELATMTVHGQDGEQIVITSPIAAAELKGCHPIQNLGAVQTYLRRYLWTALLEIIEHDPIDSSPPVEAPPAANPELVAAARNAALSGRGEFGEFWKSLTPTERKSLQADSDLIDELKKTSGGAQ